MIAYLHAGGKLFQWNFRQLQLADGQSPGGAEVGEFAAGVREKRQTPAFVAQAQHAGGIRQFERVQMQIKLEWAQVIDTVQGAADGARERNRRVFKLTGNMREGQGCIGELGV